MSSPYVLRPLRTEAQARADIARQRERAAATPPDWAHFPVAVRPCDAPAGRNGELATDPLSRPAHEWNAALGSQGVASANAAHQAPLRDHPEAARPSTVKGCEPAATWREMDGMGQQFDGLPEAITCRWCGAEGESREDVSAECEDDMCPMRTD